MSVILGYKTKDKIYLAADNRLSTIDNKLISDNSKKIVVINNCLAIAFSGNHAAQALFESVLNGIKNEKARDMRVEDALLHIASMSISFQLNPNNLYSTSCFIIAGKNRDNECCIHAASYVREQFEHTKTDIILFNPVDLDMKTCAECYIKNIKFSHQDFMQKTIKEIAVKSEVVSPSGDIWIYDLIKDEGSLEHFS